MGTYRFLLSMVVVLFHFGGFPPVSGMSAVFGFYLLSGYLMALVVDKVYSKNELGTLSFYLNRALRIFPLYIIYVVLTLVVAKLHGGTGFYIDADKPNNMSFLIPAYVSNYSALQIMHEMALSFFNVENTIKVTAAFILNGFPQIVPQAWSLSVELIFYIAVPYIVSVYKSQLGKIAVYSVFLLSIGFNIVTYINELDFPTYRYRSVFGVFFIFLSGVLLYVHRSLIPVFKYSRLIGLLTVIAYLLLVTTTGNTLKENLIYTAFCVQLIATAFIVKTNAGNTVLHKVDSFLGKLSYGVFVGHFFAAMLLYLVTEKYVISAGMYVVGKPGTAAFGLACVCLAAMLTVALHYLVEKPIDLVRDIVRHRTYDARRGSAIEKPSNSYS